MNLTILINFRFSLFEITCDVSLFYWEIPKNTSNAVSSEYFYVGVKVSISAFKFLLNVKNFKDFQAEKTNW